jgi:uncharacterized protein YeaO (DUF488 family)
MSTLAKYSLVPQCVSISASAPKSFPGLRYTALAPTWELLTDIKANKINEQQYSERYIALLEQRNITPEKLYHDLPDGAILMCYEKTGDFCHRRVLAGWLLDKHNIFIPEFTEPKLPPVDDFFSM